MRTTSPLESLHGVVKSWIQVSTLDLDLVVDKMKLAVDLQLKKIRDSMTMEGSFISSHHKSSIITIMPPLLHQSVSRFALNLLTKQYHMAVQCDVNTGSLATLKPCSGVFESTTTFLVVIKYDNSSFDGLNGRYQMQILATTGTSSALK